MKKITILTLAILICLAGATAQKSSKRRKKNEPVVTDTIYSVTINRPR